MAPVRVRPYAKGTGHPLLPVPFTRYKPSLVNERLKMLPHGVRINVHVRIVATVFHREGT